MNSILDQRDIKHIGERVLLALEDKKAIFSFSSPKQKSDYFTFAYADDVPRLLAEVSRLRAAGVLVPRSEPTP